MHLLVHVFIGAVFHELSLWRNTRTMDDSQAAMASQPEASGQPMADAPPAEATHTLFSDQHAYPFEQAVDHLCHIIFRDEDLWIVFAGHAPWTNDALQKLASSGSWYLDLVYYQVTALFKCQTTKKHDLPAPNDQFVMFYDAMVDRLPRNHPLLDDKTHLFSRNWNNKGNSLRPSCC